MNDPWRSRHRPPCLALALGSLLIVASAAAALAQAAPRIEIKDTAGMFSQRAIARAREALEQNVLKKAGIPVTIETIEELRGQTIEEAARRHAEQAGTEGILILASRRDHKIEVLASRPLRSVVTEAVRRKIQDAFIAGFKQGDFDKGLEQGTEQIVAAFANVDRDTPSIRKDIEQATAGHPSHEGGGSSTLVLRNQVRLTLGGAHRILEGAVKKATEMGLKMNIAVVDDGGHMIAFARMDGARPASGYTATTKAVTAATFRAPTGPVPPGTTTPDPLLNLSLQNAALASGGKVTTLLGGVPVVVEEQVIGGVGVGGGSGEQDATVARAGRDAFLAALKAPDEPAKAPAP